MPDKVYLVKWRNGTFSFLFNIENGLIKTLDNIAEPSGMEVRVVPPELMHKVTFDQNDDIGLYSVSVDVEEMIWQQCAKHPWPIEPRNS